MADLGGNSIDLYREVLDLRGDPPNLGHECAEVVGDAVTQFEEEVRSDVFRDVLDLGLDCRWWLHLNVYFRGFGH